MYLLCRWCWEKWCNPIEQYRRSHHWTQIARTLANMNKTQLNLHFCQTEVAKNIKKWFDRFFCRGIYWKPNMLFCYIHLPFPSQLSEPVCILSTPPSLPISLLSSFWVAGKACIYIQTDRRTTTVQCYKTASEIPVQVYIHMGISPLLRGYFPEGSLFVTVYSKKSVGLL